MSLDPRVFRGAAALIRMRGLARGCYSDGRRYCTVGALQQVTGTEGVDRLRGEVELLADLIGWEGDVLGLVAVEPHTGLAGGRVGWPITIGFPDFRALSVVTTWNDADGRTAEQVATLLEQAAEKCEAEA